jgi:hypothetical protein
MTAAAASRGTSIRSIWSINMEQQQQDPQGGAAAVSTWHTTTSIKREEH